MYRGKWIVCIIVFAGLFSGISSASYYDDALVAYYEKDFVRARASMQLAAQGGDTAAYYLLSVMYAEGKGGSADQEKAGSWLRKAAAGGDALAQFRLARQLVDTRDYSNAFELFAAAAAQGHPNALFHQVLLLQRDKIPGFDADKAKQLYAIAASELDVHAQKGSAMAQNNLAYMYETGLGVIANPFQALAWYQKAAYQGLVEAQYNLGRLLALNKKNREESEHWMQSAARQGYPPALKFLQNPAAGVALVK